MAALVSACGENQTGDVTPPTVIATSPINTQTGVSVSTTAIKATFSEAINPATINGSSFQVRANGALVPGTVTYAGVIASFAPTTALLPNTVYTATISTTVRDLVDNALASTFTWTFTTGALPDTTPPQVSAVDPVADATNVPGNRRLLATFSEAIDPASIGSTGFTVTSSPGNVPVAGTVSVSGSVLTFTPGTATSVSQLQSNTTYTARLAPTLADLSGNPLGTPFVWTFATGAIGDTTSPTLVLAEPFDTATGVAPTALIIATFSEPVNPATVSASSFVVAPVGSAPITGTFEFSGRSITFVPSVPLAASTLYSVTVTNAVTDLAGNPLVGSDVANPWTFTTGLELDVTPPFVIRTSPPAAANTVCINSTINATFNEQMIRSTVVDNFTVIGPSGEVPGIVSYNATTRTATFHQAENFVADTEYTATVTSGATDRAGNPLDMAGGPVPNPWTFRIGPTTTVCQSPVPLRSLTGFAIVAGDGLNNTASPTIINGDIATTCPGCAAPADLTLNGTLYDSTDVANQAIADLQLAFDDARGRPVGPDTPLLNGQTLKPGVYTTTGPMALDPATVLTLDALGDPSAVWVFQVGGDLSFGEDSEIVLANGAQTTNVFWVVDGTITTGNDAHIGGTLMAGTSFKLGNRTRVFGRVLTFGSAQIRRATINATTP